MTTTRCASLLALTVALALPSGPLLAGGANTTGAKPAARTFTQQQVDRGRQSFHHGCAQCHRSDLGGALGPPLKGPAFLVRWGAGSLADLMTFKHDARLASAPATLSASDVADITAFIASENGWAPGPDPLTADSARSMHLVQTPRR